MFIYNLYLNVNYSQNRSFKRLDKDETNNILFIFNDIVLEKSYKNYYR